MFARREPFTIKVPEEATSRLETKQRAGSSKVNREPMSYLKEKLDEADRKAVIDDTVKLIDAEVASKGGLSGKVLMTGYKAVKKLKGGRMIEKAVDHLLDEFTEALAPLHESYREQDSVQGFDKYLSKNDKQASDALLAITDARVDSAENKLVAKTYKTLRGQAEKHVKDALPGVGRLIDKYVD